jgi:hypothetical protein
MATGFVYQFDNGLFLGPFQPQVPITRAVIRSKTELRTIADAWRRRMRENRLVIDHAANKARAEMPGKIVPIEIKVVSDE